MLWLFFCVLIFRKMNKQVHIWLSAFIIVIVAMAAIGFAFTDFMSDRLYGNKRSVFVIVLGLYSVYRAYRLRVMLKPKKTEE